MMADVQLDRAEIESKQALLQNYSPAQRALAVLAAEEGKIQTSFEKLWVETNSVPTVMPEGQSLWEVTQEVLYDEICQDEAFKAKVEAYNNEPASAPLLTELIASVADLAGTSLNPALATIVVLWLLEFGLDAFCCEAEAPAVEV